mmetsp:Transcript_8164/g.18242  ORF Transcript_8164/g.18242 Transcript_8164/m.18242 type:complete len:711 (-) Transcript_8164:162-2294(-)
MAWQRMWRSLLLLVLACPEAGCLVAGPWSDLTVSPKDRAKRLLANMTLDEKLSLLHGPEGEGPDYTGYVPPITRLGMPPITMNDGPQGFRCAGSQSTSTAFPSGLTVAATWDREAVYAWGEAQGKEFYGKGANVMLGPGMNVARVPLNGRNFEYMSGEDPFLGYTLVQEAIKGIQSQKVVANAKHWVLNNQETNRLVVSSEVNERTRFEMYYPPFEGAIEAGVGSFMCSYNKINGAWSCENPLTLKEDLKERLGFEGYVMSDWGATHSTSIMQGLDMEMPGFSWMNSLYILPGLAAGTITQDAIDEAVLRILTPMFQVGVMDEPVSAWDPKHLEKNVSSEESHAVARQVSARATVLLKNEGSVLPLRKGKRIAVIGYATDKAILHGGGSGSVTPSYVVTPLAGITAAAGKDATVSFDSGADIDAAKALAAESDFAVVFVGLTSSEGWDRSSLALDAGKGHHQDDLISAVAKANKRTVVVVSVPGAVLMPWSKDVPAVLINFLPGQQVGSAIADVLFGALAPEGKLPITMPNEENEVNFKDSQYPGVPSPKDPAYAFYEEQLLVGYRYYEAHNISFSSGFPFGHGLSYTTFEYSALGLDDKAADGVAVAFSIRNDGSVTAREVGQLYLTFPESAGEPPLQLKGFHKTAALAPGQSERVQLLLRPRDLSIWCHMMHKWKEVRGTFGVKVGSSSRDIRLLGSFTRGGSETVLV